MRYPLPADPYFMGPTYSLGVFSCLRTAAQQIARTRIRSGSAGSRATSSVVHTTIAEWLETFRDRLVDVAPGAGSSRVKNRRPRCRCPGGRGLDRPPEVQLGPVGIRHLGHRHGRRRAGWRAPVGNMLAAQQGPPAPPDPEPRVPGSILWTDS